MKRCFLLWQQQFRNASARTNEATTNKILPNHIHNLLIFYLLLPFLFIFLFLYLWWMFGVIGRNGREIATTDSGSGTRTRTTGRCNKVEREGRGESARGKNSQVISIRMGKFITEMNVNGHLNVLHINSHTHDPGCVQWHSLSRAAIHVSYRRPFLCSVRILKPTTIMSYNGKLIIFYCWWP